MILYSSGTQVLTSTGQYFDTLLNQNGCDSVLILDLTVDSVLITNIDTAFCQGDSILIGGSVFTTAGAATDFFISTSGCDSLVIFNITVDSVSLTNIAAQFCQGDTLFFGNNIITIGGVYYDTLFNQTGCDSVIANTVSVTLVLTASLFDTICPGDSVIFDGQIITTGGTYLDSVTSSSGCDSIITLVVTLLQNSTSTINTSICQGDTIIILGNPFSSTGTQIDTILAANGCDSIVTITVVVDTVLTTSLFDTVCQGDSIQFAGQMVGSSGVYTDTINSSATGCDSIIDLTLTVLSNSKL